MGIKTWNHFPDLASGEHVILLRTSEYKGGRLTVLVVGSSDETWSQKNLITAHFPMSELTNQHCAYFNTRYHPAAYHWAIQQGICRPTGRSVVSDFCIFPEVEFTQEALQSMETLDSYLAAKSA